MHIRMRVGVGRARGAPTHRGVPLTFIGRRIYALRRARCALRACEVGARGRAGECVDGQVRVSKYLGRGSVSKYLVRVWGSAWHAGRYTHSVNGTRAGEGARANR